MQTRACCTGLDYNMNTDLSRYKVSWLFLLSVVVVVIVAASSLCSISMVLGGDVLVVVVDVAVAVVEGVDIVWLAGVTAIMVTGNFFLVTEEEDDKDVVEDDLSHLGVI